MKAIFQHNRPLTLNLLSGTTLRLNDIGQEFEIADEDVKSPEFQVAIDRHQVRTLTPVSVPAPKKESNNESAPGAPANTTQDSANKKGK